TSQDCWSLIISYLDINTDENILHHLIQQGLIDTVCEERIIKEWEKCTKYEIKEDEKKTKTYYRNGMIYRDNDLPAIEYHNGSKKWYKNGKVHRDDDKPAMILLGEIGIRQYW